jgi:A/G-specific adenine glycosylase
MTLTNFQNTIWDYYHAHKRSFPWRQTRDPYHIFVSEIMLQQTQTERVIPKYLLFIKMVPNFQSLSALPTLQLLKLWQGLGYNRRALNMKKSAEIICEHYEGILPQNAEQLIGLPGIGKGTVGSLLAFAYQKPVVFIETNIRRVFIHFFFSDQENIDDKELLPLIEKSLDTKNPREWYYALMDYGANLGKQKENPNLKSKHHKKQSKFEGSTRQLRGKIIRLLTQSTKPLTTTRIAHCLEQSEDTVERILSDLAKEGFIEIDDYQTWILKE